MTVPKETGNPADVLTRLLEPDILEDPYPYYAWLRENSPVYWSERAKVYVLSRHADVRRAYGSPDLRGPEEGELTARVPRTARYRSMRLLMQTIAMTNPPVHTRLRKHVAAHFTPRRVAEQREGTLKTCERLLDSLSERLHDGETLDLHEEVSKTFATHVIADLLGVPHPDRSHLSHLVARVLKVADPVASEEAMADADRASNEVEAYFSSLAEQRRRVPRGDLITALASPHDGSPDNGSPDRLSDPEILTMIWTLWVSGFETAAAATDLAVMAALRHPDEAKLLSGGTEGVESFISESLRHESPIVLTGVLRIAVRDIEIAGTRIPAGSDIRVLPGSANRDPAVFPHPDRFDPARDTSPTMAFGHGLHYCLGVRLARMELAVVLPGLFTRYPGLAPAGTPVRRPSLTLRTFDRLPVALDR